MDRKHQRFGTRVVELPASRSFVAKTLAAGAHSGQRRMRLNDGPALPNYVHQGPYRRAPADENRKSSGQ